MTDELEKKVRQSVSLIQKAVGDKVVEVAYSGGKDSDVILELTKMAGVKYRAIKKQKNRIMKNSERAYHYLTND